MKMKRYLLTSILLQTWCAVALAANLFPVGTPTRAIQDLDKMLEGYVVAPKTPEERAYNQELKRKALHGTFDIRSLAQQALAKNWEKLSAKDQDHFVQILSELLESKAVFAKEQGTGRNKGAAPYEITYQGHEFLGGNQKALVKSSVRVPSENLKISLNYKMNEIDRPQTTMKDPVLGQTLPVPQDWPMEKGWRIFDVVVDDASLLDNYRYQFDAIIRKGGYEDLIRRMEEKLQKMKAKQEAAHPEAL